MKWVIRALLIGVIAIPLSGYAGVGSGEFNVLMVEVTDNFFTVYSASGPINNEGCQDASKVVFWRGDYPTGYDSMLSVALAAHMGNRKVTMWLYGCKAGPWGLTLPVASSIVVREN